MFSSDQQYSVDRLSPSTNKQHEFWSRQPTHQQSGSSIHVNNKRHPQAAPPSSSATTRRRTQTRKQRTTNEMTTQKQKTATEPPSERFDPTNATATTLTTNNDTDHRFDPANDLPNHAKTKHRTQTDKKTASSQRVLANKGDCQTTKGAKSEAEQSH